MQPHQQLEIAWAEFNNLDPAGMVSCSSGTAALHLALEAFQLPQGSEVIVPDFTMIACPRSVTLAGLKPVFVDCGDDLLMKHSLITKAAADADVLCAMIVHIYGRQFKFGDNWDAPGCYIIEDLAEAHGIRPHPQTDAACWSFYKNKIVAGEEGGAVWFKNTEHARLARQLRSLGFTEAHDFDHVPRGHNYRMSNAHAQLVLDDFTSFTSGEALSVESMYEDRRQIERWYDEVCPAEWGMPRRDAPWVYDLRIPRLSRQKQAEIVKALNDTGIAARMSFLPMSCQKEYRRCRQVAAEGYSRAVIASKQVFYLPLTPGSMDQAKCRLAFEVIKKLAPS